MWLHHMIECKGKYLISIIYYTPMSPSVKYAKRHSMVWPPRQGVDGLALHKCLTHSQPCRWCPNIAIPGHFTPLQQLLLLQRFYDIIFLRARHVPVHPSCLWIASIPTWDTSLRSTFLTLMFKVLPSHCAGSSRLICIYKANQQPWHNLNCRCPLSSLSIQALALPCPFRHG